MKPWRGPKHKKITPKMAEKMLELRESGWILKDLANHFNISISTVRYHTSPGDKEKTRERAYKSNKKRRQNETPDERAKRTNYLTRYMNERYNNDLEFRERMKMHVRNSQNRTSRTES